MDEMVKAAMAKWPQVPACYGWLGLDARGHWFMRDDQVQAQGPFVQARGSRLRHDKLIGFIERNYEPDEAGRWYFQNGPQRVYVELEATPWIARVQADGQVQAHTGPMFAAQQVQGALIDEDGHVALLLPGPRGPVPARVHSQDVVLLPDWLQAVGLDLQEMPAAQWPERFGYVSSPKAQPACA